MPSDAIYTVTEVYPSHVVLDANHPLAGIALNIDLTVRDVREATTEEIEARTVAGIAAGRGRPAATRPPAALMKIAVVGAGAIGGLIGRRLADAGHDVAMLARDTTLAALREHGLRLPARRHHRCRLPVRAAQHAHELGEQDVVVVAVKAQALPGAGAVAGAAGRAAHDGPAAR